MNYFLLQFFFMMIPALVSVVYALLSIKREKMSLYRMMTILALGCLALGNLSYIIGHYTYTLDNYFNIGSLGSLGMCLFLLVANLNFTVPDDDNKRNIRVRKLIALSAPILIIGIYIAFFIFWWKLTHAIAYFNELMYLFVTIMSAITAYTALKRALVPSEKGSHNATHRAFNIALICFMFLSTISRGLLYLPLSVEINGPLFIIFYILQALNILALVPLLKKGVVA